MKSLDLSAEHAAVLPERATQLVISLAFVSSRVNANSAFISIASRGSAGNSVVGAAGSTVNTIQAVSQNAINF